MNVPTRYIIDSADPDDANALLVIEHNWDIVSQFVEAQRANYRLGSVPILRAFTVTPDIAIRYQNIGGMETVLLSPYPVSSVTTAVSNPSVPSTPPSEQPVVTPPVTVNSLCMLVLYGNDKLAAYDMKLLPNLASIYKGTAKTISWPAGQAVTFQLNISGVGYIQSAIPLTPQLRGTSYYVLSTTLLTDGVSTSYTAGTLPVLMNANSNAVYTTTDTYNTKLQRTAGGGDQSNGSPYFVDGSGTYYYLDAGIPADTVNAALPPTTTPATASMSTTAAYTCGTNQEFIQYVPGVFGYVAYFANDSTENFNTVRLTQLDTPSYSFTTQVLTNVHYTATAKPGGTPQLGTVTYNALPQVYQTGNQTQVVQNTTPVSVSSGSPLWFHYTNTGGKDNLVTVEQDYTYTDYVTPTSITQAYVDPLDPYVYTLDILMSTDDSYGYIVVNPSSTLNGNTIINEEGSITSDGPGVVDVTTNWPATFTGVANAEAALRASAVKIWQQIETAQTFEVKTGQSWFGYDYLKVVTYTPDGVQPPQITGQFEATPLYWPPGINGQYYLQLTDMGSLEQHYTTPYEALPVGNLLNPWLHVSNGTHYVQGYSTGPTGQLVPKLYIDGADFTAKLLADLSTPSHQVKATDLVAVYMDIRLDTVQAL